MSIIEGEKLLKTLEKKPFKDLSQNLDFVIGDAFTLNTEFLDPLKKRIEHYLINELKTTRGGIFFGKKSFEIEDLDERDIQDAIKAITGSEIAHLNGSFFLTPSGYTEKSFKKYIKKLPIMKNNNQQIAYWNKRKIYPIDILKKGNFKIIDENQYLIFMRGDDKNSDFLRTEDGEYFVMGF